MVVLAVLASCLKLRHATTVGVAPPPLAANDFSLVCFFFVCFLLACRGWWKALPHDVEFCFLTFPHSTAQLGTKKEKKNGCCCCGFFACLPGRPFGCDSLSAGPDTLDAWFCCCGTHCFLHEQPPAQHRTNGAGFRWMVLLFLSFPCVLRPRNAVGSCICRDWVCPNHMQQNCTQEIKTPVWVKCS